MGAPTGISEVYKLFKDGYPNLTAFKADWDQLTEDDKAELVEEARAAA